MVFRRRRPARRPRRKARKAARKVRVPRNRLLATTQSAHIRETIQFNYVNANTNYGFTFSLNQFLRASALARNFKWYKAKSVEWVIEPLFNTFTDDGTPQSIPYTYMVMNRTQDSALQTLQDFQAMGCKPKKLTTKRVIKYTPNWCSPGLMSFIKDSNSYVRELYQNGLKPQYGYLACPATSAVDSQDQLIPIVTTDNPIATAVPVVTNQVVYNGHDMFFAQALPNGSINVAQIVCTVVWEFKDPYYRTPTTERNVIQPASASA